LIKEVLVTHRTFPARLRSVAALATGFALLVGCAPVTEQWQPAVSEAQKTNKVEFSRLAHTVRFAPGAAALTPAETTRLAGFLDDSDIIYGDHLYLQMAPDDSLSQKRQAAIRRALARRGVLLSTVPATAGAVGERLTLGDEMTVAVERYTVTPPNCPDWTKPSGSDPTNSASSNFGCATATNLGMMVAQPRDLLVGRQPGPADAQRALYAIQNYRAGTKVMLPDDLTGGSGPGSSAAAPVSSAPGAGATAGAGG
jgi:pilus assembly protein CpaD